MLHKCSFWSEGRGGLGDLVAGKANAAEGVIFPLLVEPGVELADHLSTGEGEMFKLVCRTIF